MQVNPQDRVSRSLEWVTRWLRVLREPFLFGEFRAMSLKKLCDSVVQL